MAASLADTALACGSPANPSSLWDRIALCSPLALSQLGVETASQGCLPQGTSTSRVSSLHASLTSSQGVQLDHINVAQFPKYSIDPDRCLIQSVLEKLNDDLLLDSKLGNKFVKNKTKMKQSCPGDTDYK